MKVIILTYFIYKKIFYEHSKNFSKFFLSLINVIQYATLIFYCNVQTPTQKRGFPLKPRTTKVDI